MQELLNISDSRNRGAVLQHGNVPASLLVSRYAASLDAKEATRKEYRKAVGLYLSWVESSGRRLDGLTKEDIVAYKDDLLHRDNELSSRTVALYLAAVRSFYSWAESEKLYPDIASGVKAPRMDKRFVKWHLSADQCRELLEKMADDVDNKVRRGHYANGRANGLRDLALVNLLMRTGMRTVEVSRANIGDITTRRGKDVIMVLGKGKSSKDDFIPLSPKARKTLDDYLATRPATAPSEPLFACEGYGSRGRRLSARRIQEIVKAVLREIGIDGHEYSAHSLRHTCAVLLLEAGVDPYDVQKYMRHRSIDTTEIYLESIEEKRRLERAAERLIDDSV